MLLHKCTKNENHMMYGSLGTECERHNFLSFWGILCPFTLVYHKWQSCDIWFLRYQEQQTEFLVILGHFWHFYLINSLKNQNFEKTKKASENIIILHLCTANDNHVINISWDMEHDRQKFFIILGHFCLFPLLRTQKIKVLKNWKKLKDILLFHTCVSQMTSKSCLFPETWTATDIIFYNFGPFFALLPPFFTSGDIILHNVPKNLIIGCTDHWSNWSCDECNFYFSFWAIFCLFIP